MTTPFAALDAIEMSGFVQIMGAFFGFLGVVVSSVMAYLMARLKIEAVKTKQLVAVAAHATDEARIELKAGTAVAAAKLDGVHTLVNSQHSGQLRITALALRRVADLTGHKDDIAAAELAETLLAEHKEQEKKVEEANKAAEAANRTGPPK